MLEDCENVDIRDRGYFYWRMLVHDPELTNELLKIEKPIISD